MQQGFRAQRDKTPFDKLAQAFARTRLGGWLFVNVFPVINRRLIPLTSSRLAVAVGQPMLLLHTRGARSGQPRSTPLLYTRHGRGYVVVASKAGADQPKAPSVRNCGGWSMTTTTATGCTSSGRASGLSRSCCSSQRDGPGHPSSRHYAGDQRSHRPSGSA